MELTRTQTDTIPITEENLLPIVNRHLEKVTAAQWAVLVNGRIDLEMQAILAGMLADIVQTVSAVLLRVLLPKIQEASEGNTDQADSGLTPIKADLGDSLLKSFSTCLNAPQDSYEDAQQLTKLTEEEIEERVNSLLNEATETKVLPPKPAIFVSGLMSNIKRLGNMAFHAARCLRECLLTLNSKCCKPKQYIEISDSDSCKSNESNTSFILTESTAEGVSDILMKWSGSETGLNPESGHVSPISTSHSAKSAAAEIVNIIIENVKTPETVSPSESSESSVPRGPHFNMELIIDKVRSFFASRPGHTDTATEPEVNKQSFFSRFVKKHFDSMEKNLKKAFERQDENFILKLWHESTSQLPGNFLLPGSVPDSPEPEKSPVNTQKRLVTMIKQGPSDITFGTFKANLDNFIKEMNYSDENLQEKLENVSRCEEVRQFSKELTDKMYTHLMAAEVYQLPIVPKGKCLSDSVISKIKKTMDGTQRAFSPEVLYSITEDAVGKFLQQVFLWMVTQPSDDTDEEKVSGALADIEDLLIKKVSQSPEDRSEFPKVPASPSYLPQDHCEIRKVNEDFDKKVEITTIKEQNLTEAEVPKVESFEESSSGYYEEESPKVTVEVIDSSSESLANGLVLALLVRLLSKIETKNKHLVPDIEKIKERLLYLVKGEVDSDEVSLNEDNMKDITKVVVKELYRKFGTTQNLLNAAMAQNSTSFDKSLIMSLKYHLNVTKQPEKKTKIGRFFSRIGGALERAVGHLRKNFNMTRSS